MHTMLHGGLVTTQFTCSWNSKKSDPLVISRAVTFFIP